MNDLRSWNKFWVFTLLLFFVACQDGENPAQPEPADPKPVPVEPVDIADIPEL